MDSCTAAVAHQVPRRPPVQIRPGQIVEIARLDDEWPEFVFVITDEGDGWVPARYLSASHGFATVTTGYDTTELATVVGERLEIVVRDPVSGWTWCRNSAGLEGWVPDRTLVMP